MSCLSFTTTRCGMECVHPTMSSSLIILRIAWKPRRSNDDKLAYVGKEPGTDGVHSTKWHTFNELCPGSVADDVERIRTHPRINPKTFPSMATSMTSRPAGLIECPRHVWGGPD